MTKEELAKALNGTDLFEIVSEELKKAARDNNLVIIYGYSDDLLELEGAIRDEVDAWQGVTVQLSKKGLSMPTCKDPECCCNLQADPSARAVKASTNVKDSEYFWTIETEIPHATFDILDKRDDEYKFCRGIVIDLKEVW
jgi:hypothetical protein